MSDLQTDNLPDDNRDGSEWNYDILDSEMASPWLSAIIDSADDAIITKSLDGIITSWNPGAQRIFGYERAEVVGKHISILIPPQHIDEEPRILARLRRGERIKHYETERVRKDGKLINISLTVSPILKPDGTIVGASKIARDITDRKQSEARLQEVLAEQEKAREEAERANQAKSAFLSRMSHELRTPLNAILGFSQILEMEEHTPSQGESLGLIMHAGRHLLSLINEVLDISRVEAGQMSLMLEPTSVYQIVQESLDLVRPLAVQQRVQVNSNVGGGEGFILADQQRLKQVLLNLLTNGVKYNHQGGQVMVSCKAVPGERLRLEVTDTGIGISPEDLGKLFTPFERLDAEKQGVEGTGLGLVLSQRLVTAMNGNLGLESIKGTGSTFYIELPQAPGPQTAPVSPNTEPKPAAPVTPLRKHSILYIEDNLSNYRLLEAILKRRPQIDLLGAMQGSLGLELARQHRPDLILLDLHLPDMMGHVVLRHLRQDPLTSAIPIVVVSADATQRQIERLLSPDEGHRGADTYLTKPLNIRELLDVLDHYGRLRENNRIEQSQSAMERRQSS